MIKTKSFQKSSKKRYELLQQVFRDARMARGISQQVLAEDLGAAQTQVSRVERGADVPDVVEFLEWCKQLELDPRVVIAKLMSA
jgi:transcriptional regulator with XRE-family HTH domain